MTAVSVDLDTTACLSGRDLEWTDTDRQPPPQRRDSARAPDEAVALAAEVKERHGLDPPFMAEVLAVLLSMGVSPAEVLAAYEGHDLELKPPPAPRKEPRDHRSRRGPLRQLTCPLCGAQFDTHHRSRRFCTTGCRLAFWTRQETERKRAQRETVQFKWKHQGALAL